MTFRRTSSGLSNLYLFLGVDFIVFLEGGTSISRNDVENDIYDSSSEDISYWNSLFRYYYPDKNIQYRSVGSKSVVKSIALDIASGDISNVVTAMDRDFDNYSNNIIVSDNVLYTCGYAWENDCWSDVVITESIISLSGTCSTKRSEIYNKVSLSLNGFASQMKQPIKADSLLIQNEFSLFERDGYQRYFMNDRSGRLVLNKEEIKKSFRKSRENVGRPIYRSYNLSSGDLCDCFGHLLADYSYRLLFCVLKDIGNFPNLPKCYATSVAITKFSEAFASGQLASTKAHYDNAFSSLNL